MIDENLRPGTGSQANDQDAARLWVNSAERECTDDEICIVGGIDQKRAIVNAAAKNRAVRKNRYDAIAILDDLCERQPGLRTVVKNQPFVKEAIAGGRSWQERHAK